MSYDTLYVEINERYYDIKRATQDRDTSSLTVRVYDDLYKYNCMYVGYKELSILPSHECWSRVSHLNFL